MFFLLIKKLDDFLNFKIFKNAAFTNVFEMSIDV